jgi:hypothetical protein
MIRRPVTSSNIASIGWEDGVLEVEFKSGHHYAYADVPEGVYQEAIGAGSVGKFVAANIVGKYQSQRLK